MKWFLLPHKTSRKPWGKKAQYCVKPWLIAVMFCPFVGFLFLSEDVFSWRSKGLAFIPSELVAEKVNQTAAEITVKISGQDFLGSGIIFQQQDEQYLVLTNQHVLRGGKPPFKIQTSDGKVYEGQVVTKNTFSQDDLALLSFRSDRNKYQTASLGDYSQLLPGESVFAAGFPSNSELLLTQSATEPGFTLTKGKVAIVLDKPLQEGYQIAYSNNVQKGMSGGPLLDQQGKLVGINGKHAYPLWEAPDLYQDNSQPCQPLQELITRSSLAIPIERALVLASQPDSNDRFLTLPQSNQIFSTIATEKTSQTVMEVEETSSQPCQVK
jgi:serine protease Do